MAIKSVYIASPYTIGNKEENVKRQIDAANILIDAGYYPFYPLSCHYMNERKERSYDEWMDYDYFWLSKCDYILRLKGESKGADSEVAFAIDNDIPVYNEIDLLLEEILTDANDDML